MVPMLSETPFSSLSLSCCIPSLRCYFYWVTSKHLNQYGVQKTASLFLPTCLIDILIYHVEAFQTPSAYLLKSMLYPQKAARRELCMASKTSQQWFILIGKFENSIWVPSSACLRLKGHFGRSQAVGVKNKKGQNQFQCVPWRLSSR